MTPRCIDTHCHPQLGAFNDDRGDVIQRALEAEVGMVVVGTTLSDSQAAVDLVKKYAGQPLWAAIGVHPTDETLADLDLTLLRSLVEEPEVVAIGETGLDYFHVDDPEEQQFQRDAFEQHVLLAKESGKPLLIHCRDLAQKYGAYNDVLTVLRRLDMHQFVMHCYSGDWAHAEQFLEMGGYISVPGIVTFPKSETMQDVAKRVPADRLLIETDSPFLAPVPHRGKRNEPVFVIETAKKVAELRGVSLDEIAQTTTANAKKVLGL